MAAYYTEVMHMSGISGISAYQQAGEMWKSSGTSSASQRTKSASKSDTAPAKDAGGDKKVEMKPWSPLDAASSLIPRKADYGYTIGDVQLSEKAAAYYDKLKSKFGNMEFIAVSGDMKDQVQKNAASYGNPSKMVVLIDAEKIERMATDDSFRKKYEGIISMSASKLTQMKNSLASSGASVSNFGMSVDSNGKENFFATVEKSQAIQKKRIEEKKAAKKEEKAKEKKKAEKKEREEKIKKSREEAKKTDKEEKDIGALEAEEKDYVTIHARSMDDLTNKVAKYSYDAAASRSMTEEEQNVGTRIDFRW
jgi:hypothetical protein